MLKRLKIAMIFSYDPSQTGGVQEHIRLLSDSMQDLGHQVDIYGPEKNIYKFRNYHSIAKSIRIPIPNGSWSNITIEKEDIEKIMVEFNKEKYDIVHFHDPYVPFVGWEIMKKNQSKKIATFHSAWEKRSIISIINPFINLFQDTFSTIFSGTIFVSKIVKSRWEELSGKKVEQIIIHNAVDKIFFPLNKKATSGISLLFLGRLVEKKGPRYLLKSFIKIIKKYPKTNLVIVGDGPIKKSLEKYVKKKGLENNVTFVGQIIGQKRVKYYQKADIFCAPYYDEAFGITVLEAMATGTPIVGFNNSAFKEILKGYPYPDLLVKAKDSDKLALAIEELIKNKNKRLKISPWLIKESKKYSWKKIAQQTETFYYKVLNI